jgi:ribosomal protein S18 acetylase RimI-like enzyme
MNTAPAEFLEWDSHFFGVRIGRVHPGPLIPEVVEAWRREHHIRCLYYLAELSDTPSIHAAQDLGFHYMDIRTTFFTSLPVLSEFKSSYSIRRAVSEDLPNLCQLTTGSFIHSRFYNDPHFSREKCDQLYAIWVEKQLQQTDAIVWVSEDGTGLTGFVTVIDLSPVRTSISLIGIATHMRGKGLGRALVNHVLRDSGDRGMAEFEVVTQASNSGAMKLNQSCGMKVALQQIWLHGWFE